MSFDEKELEKIKEETEIWENEYNNIPKREDRKSTRLNSSHIQKSRMPSSA